MKITTHGEFLTQLTKYPNFFPVNCYLVRETDGLTLIDSGLPGGAMAILEAARNIGLPIVRIALTHAHGDHVGSLDALRTSLPGAEVLISTRDARLLAGDKTLDPTEPKTPVKGSFSRVETRPTRLLEPGDHVGSLEVIATPGHTPGHIAFFDRRDGSLIAGDAMQTAGGTAVSGTVRPFFPWPAFATWHRPTAISSARRLLDLRPARLAIGHGAVLENPANDMEAAITTAARRADGEQSRAH